MKIADGIYALELQANMHGRQMTIYPTLLLDGENVVLVDAGFPGMLPSLREAVSKTGSTLEKIDTVLLTHQDIDHIGSLPDLIHTLGGNVKVLCHAEEKPYVQGEKPFIKMTPEHMKRMAESIPAERRAMFEKLLSNPPKAKVDETVADGQVLPLCGGIRVLFTPGHTPGHIALYHEKSKTLITGDSLNVEDGQLVGPRPSATYDMPLAIRSLEKYKDLDIAAVICYHGGVFTGNAGLRIQEIIKEAL